MMQSTSWEMALRTELAANPGAGFRWLHPDAVPQVREVLLDAADSSPFAGEAKEEGKERIRRSVPLATGPSRPMRLGQDDAPMVVLFDPEHPDAVWASLGAVWPAQLWARAEPTLAGIQRDFGCYLHAGFKSRAALARTVRVRKGTLEGIGIESLEAFAALVARLEPWLDGKATWGSGCDDDPWPDDPRDSSMIVLHAAGRRAAEQHPARARSITMRTLWSRSLLTIEHARCDTVTFELRYDPAPFVTRLPAGDGHLLVPSDLPLDLLASLIRGSSTTLESLDAAREAEGLTPEIAYRTSVLAPGEGTTFDVLRQLVTSADDLDAREEAVSTAADAGARGLVYAAACDETDPELRAEMLAWIEMSPTGDEDEDDEGDEDEGDEDEGDEDEDEDDLGDGDEEDES